MLVKKKTNAGPSKPDSCSDHMTRRLMNQLTFIATVLLVLAGCTTQGRLTYLSFEQSSSYEELQAQMELLKYEAYDGSVQQKVSALKEARWISKYMDDVGKREIAVRALAFMAFGSDDGDVRERSLSRITDILESPEWPAHLKRAALNGVFDVTTGELGFQELVDDQPMRFGVEVDQRVEAIEYLVESLPEWDVALQTEAASGLKRFFTALPTLERCPVDICDEGIRKDIEQWGNMAMDKCPDSLCSDSIRESAGDMLASEEPAEKKEWQGDSEDLKQQVWEQLKDLLRNNDLPLWVRAQVVLLAGETHRFGLSPSRQETFDQIVQDQWVLDEEIPSELRQMISASQERLQLYGFPANQPPVPSSGMLTDLETQPTIFLLTHWDAVLQQQLTKQQTGQRGNAPAATLLAFPLDGYDDDAMIKRAVVQQILLPALERGYRFDDSNVLNQVLQALDRLHQDLEISETPETVRLALLQQLSLVAHVYPSLKAQGTSPMPLLELLRQQVDAAEGLDLQRRYLSALLAAHALYPEDVEPLVGSLATLDVVTQHQVDAVIAPVAEALPPLPADASEDAEPTPAPET